MLLILGKAWGAKKMMCLEGEVDEELTGHTRQAEQQGLLTPNAGDVIYEGTVGSTGISLATVCRARGYTAYM